MNANSRSGTDTQDSVLGPSHPHGSEPPPPRPDSLLIAIALALLLCGIWVTYYERLAAERRQAISATAELNATLAVALEQYTVRVLKTSEAVTSLIGRDYARGVRGPELLEVLEDRVRANDVFSGLAVLTPEGQVISSTGRAWAAGTRVALEGLYRMQERAATPVQLGQPGSLPGATPTISIARVTADALGAPAAVIVALVDSPRFLRVFESADLSQDTLIVLAGTDGTPRAAWNGKYSQSSFGRVKNIAGMFTEPSGYPSSNLDGVARIIGSRRLDGYPLVAIVGTRESDAMRQYAQRRVSHLWTSFAVSLLALLFAAALVLSNRKRDKIALTLERARSRLRELNTDLEGKVAMRTAQLRAANHDLQLFSYSVAHDVRAPLSTIDGFSRLIEPAIKATGDAKQIHYLARIRASARQMSELTESMLQLARLSEKGVAPRMVDVTAMAQAVARELQERDPARTVEITIEPGLSVMADAALLRQVFENLMGNAWKFTARRDHARIQVGALPPQEDGQTCFFVRDNGAGFDMDRQENLFKPFHRLHRQDEFEGTGMGLAMVKRIIALHQGRLWAESAVDAGATFHFCLPKRTAGSELPGR